MKKFIYTIMLMVPFAGIKAQVEQGELKSQVSEKQNERSAMRTTFVADSPKDHWFVTVSGGISDLLSEESDYIDFSKRIKPGFGLSIGRWMSPAWGLRINITGSKLQGFTTWNDNSNTGWGDWFIGKKHPFANNRKETNTYLAAWTGGETGAEIKRRFLDKPTESKDGPGYTYEVPYAGASLDFLLNMNYFFGAKYKEDRLLNPILYGGLGYAHTFGDQNRDQTHINSIMEKFGLMLDFRLSKKWSVNVDAQTLIVPEIFDWRVGDGNTQDVVMNYNLGITYKFGNGEFTPVQFMNPEEISSLNNRINQITEDVKSTPAHSTDLAITDSYKKESK